MTKALLLLVMILLSGCGPATIPEVRKEIEKTGHSIEQKQWREAAENVKKAEDWWHFVTHKYNKKDSNELDKMLHDLDLAIAGKDTQKSRDLWGKLKQKWNQMNATQNQVK